MTGGALQQAGGLAQAHSEPGDVEQELRRVLMSAGSLPSGDAAEKHHFRPSLLLSVPLGSFRLGAQQGVLGEDGGPHQWRSGGGRDGRHLKGEGTLTWKQLTNSR